MKQIMLLPLLLVVVALDLQSQTGDQCDGVGFTYFERTGTGLVSKCSTQQAPDPAKVKQNMPFRLCLELGLSPLDQELYRNVCYPDDFSAKFLDALQEAMNEWNRICPNGEVNMSIGDEACDGHIGAIDDPDVWRSQYTGNPLNPTSEIAEAWPGGKAKDGTDRPPRIILNFTEEFSKTLQPPRFHTGVVWAYDGQCSQLTGGLALCNNGGSGNYDKNCVSVKTVLLHELGHMLGLGHMRLNGCSNESTIMMNALNYGAFFDQDPELVDKCAIRTLYCPDALLMSDNTHEVSTNIYIYPNPVKNVLYIQTPMNMGVEKIEIYNVLGDTIFRESNPSVRSLFEINIDGMSKGVYFIAVFRKERVEIQRFILK